MRVVSTRVLPVPAPASTSTGPSSVSTASRCSGLSPVEILRGRRGARTRGNAASRGLVLGNAVMGQLARLGHANRLVPTMAPRGGEGEPS